MLNTATLFVTVASLATVSIAVEPITCPFENQVGAQFVSISDVVLTGEELAPSIGPDFLRDVLDFTEEEIERTTEDALTFFSEMYGLDFSQSDPDELGTRFIPESGATFTIYGQNPAQSEVVTFNRWIINGNERTLCFENRNGGFTVSFNSTSMLFGSYGGEEGSPINQGDTLFYGFYRIPVCPQSPIIIRFTSATPARVEPEDGFGIINCDLFHREMGHGVAQGVYRVRPLGDDQFHYTFRNFYTFPGHPGLAGD